mmetsp:Transcript_7078/g.17281  ORF Transcript_7078/g.17281 Transcript_7078/m.17281 type:complete len:87 (-) Transcript_7078:178-438(-)
MVNASLVRCIESAIVSQPFKHEYPGPFTKRNSMSRSQRRNSIPKSQCFEDRTPRTSLESDADHSIQFVDILEDDLESNQSEPDAEM